MDCRIWRVRVHDWLFYHQFCFPKEDGWLKYCFLRKMDFWWIWLIRKQEILYLGVCFGNKTWWFCGWLNHIRSREGSGYFWRWVNSMLKSCGEACILSRFTVAISVSMIGVGGKGKTFVRGNGVPRDLWHSIFRLSCWCSGAAVIIFSTIGTALYESFEAEFAPSDGLPLAIVVD